MHKLAELDQLISPYLKHSIFKIQKSNKVNDETTFFVVSKYFDYDLNEIIQFFQKFNIQSELKSSPDLNNRLVKSKYGFYNNFLDSSKVSRAGSNYIHEAIIELTAHMLTRVTQIL